MGIARECFLELFAERHGEGSDRIWGMRWILSTMAALGSVEDGFQKVSADRCLRRVRLTT